MNEELAYLERRLTSMENVVDGLNQEVSLLKRLVAEQAKTISDMYHQTNDGEYDI